MDKNTSKGQSILEVLVAVAVGAVLVIAGIGLIAPALQTNKGIGLVQAITAAAKQLGDNVKVWSELDWHNIANLSTSTNSSYYLNASQSPFTIVGGVEPVTYSSSTVLNRYFQVGDVYRTPAGDATTSVAGNSYDPSTKAVNIMVIQSGSRLSPLTFATSSWATTTPLPATPDNDTSFQNSWTALFTTNGYVYAVGGMIGINPQTTVYYSKITGMGTVGSWATTTPTPNAFDGNILGAAYNGYLYLLAGGTSQTATTTVYYAKSNADGTLTSWATTTPLGNTYNGAAVTAYNGYLYAIGGNNTNFTWYAKINSDGTIGAWQQGVTAPGGGGVEQWASAVPYNGYIYIPGGGQFGTTGSPTTTVYYAAVNSNGSLGAWKKASSSLPAALGGATALAVDHCGSVTSSTVSCSADLYAMAGDATGKTVYSAPINPDGTIGTWVQGANLPNPGNGYHPFDFVNIGTSVLAIRPQTAIVQTVAVQPPVATPLITMYVTRNMNQGFVQSDWSGGPGDSAATLTPVNDFNVASSSITYTTPGMLTIAGGGVGALSYVQGVTSAATNTISATFGSNVSTGSNALILVAISYWGSVPITPAGPPTDTAGNVYTLVKSANTGITNPPNILLYQSTGRASGGPDTISFGVSGANQTELSMTIMEFNGADEQANTPISSVSGSGNSATVNSGNVTGLSSGDLIVGVETHSSNNAGTASGKAGYTFINVPGDLTNTTQPLGVEFKVSTTTGSASSSFTYTGADTWAHIGADFHTGHGPFTFKQSTTTFFGNLGNQNISSVSARFPNTVNTADVIVAAVSMVTTTASMNLTDSLGNVYNQIGSTLKSSGAVPGYTRLYYAINSTTASDTLTFAQNPSVNGSITLTAGDFTNVNGLSPIDQFKEATDTNITGTTASAGSISPAQGGELFIGAGTWTDQVTETLGAGFSPVTAPFIDAQAGQPLVLEYFIPNNNPPTTVSHSFGSATRWTMHGAAFLPRGFLVVASGTLETAVFDTGITTGAQLNSVMWKGTQQTNSTVGFQFAVSNNANGPWNYMGPDGTSNTYYSPNVGVAMPLSYTLFNNFRYFRYRVLLSPDPSFTNRPTITDIIVNWSP